MAPSDLSILSACAASAVEAVAKRMEKSTLKLSALFISFPLLSIERGGLVWLVD